MTSLRGTSEGQEPRERDGVGCACGWPVDSCNPKFAREQPCDRLRRERETTSGTLARLARCRDRLAAAELERDELIFAAIEQGCSEREIGKAAVTLLRGKSSGP